MVDLDEVTLGADVSHRRQGIVLLVRAMASVAIDGYDGGSRGGKILCRNRT